MITITLLLLTAGIAVWYGLSRSTLMKEGRKTKFWMTIVLILIVGVFISVVQPFRIKRVDAGHVGIMVNLTGDDRGISKYEYKTGWVLYNTWIAQLYEFPTYQQHIDYPDQVVITKGGFQTTIKPSFNYSLIAGHIGDMFLNLRLPLRDVEQQWLMTAIISSVNDVANTWTVDDIFNNREKFEAAIVAEAVKRTNKWFVISQLRTNILPPDALRNSIEAKTKAIQEVQVAENQKKVAEAEALRKIAVARGDSAQAVIAAAGRAEAIKLEQLQLTSIYIEYLRVSKWDGKNPTTVLSGNSGAIIQLPK
jgi:regulator of protease activity HflC (stomatin/prohibitin superfamily)